jgi:hypothetical protein
MKAPLRKLFTTAGALNSYKKPRTKEMLGGLSLGSAAALF